jgi:hypothetical protein
MPLRDLSAGEARHIAGARPGRQRTVKRELALSRRGFIAATLGFGGSGGRVVWPGVLLAAVDEG